jgi:hypothetical protein
MACFTASRSTERLRQVQRGQREKRCPRFLLASPNVRVSGALRADFPLQSFREARQARDVSKCLAAVE